MTFAGKRSSWWGTFFGTGPDTLALALDLLRHCYIREKQQAIRYRAHAERMRYAQFRERLIQLADAEEAHVVALQSKLEALGGRPPDVTPVYVLAEQNSWSYLQADLEEEQRGAGELEADLAAINKEFPDVVELLRRIEDDARVHRAALRDMLARSDPQAAALP